MTEMSRERRDRLLEEMHEMGDSRVVTDDPQRLESFTSPLTYDELRALLRDSAWRERVERDVRELADTLRAEVYSHDPMRAFNEYDAGLSRRAETVEDQLRAIVDTGDEEGQ